ncbi:MAG TPA: ribosome maturation factor RimP [Solirubrobacteraceae bacterium]|nr:ribosome maturation factor RimP [Solirubrobacteraceae bacterium]
MEQLQNDIQQRISASEPEVEVLLVERAGDTLRIFIDHPAGVTLALCERVTGALGDLRERYGIEVSSPGPRRPLTKPEHFQRFVGRRARVRTASHADLGERGSVTGELIGATAQEVTLAVPDGIVAIPYAAIQRSHLVEE